MKSKRCGEIEIMRFVFCIFVILFHCNQKMFGLTTLKTAVLTWAPRGYIGVEFFFLLSGMFFAVSVSKISEKSDKDRRANNYLKLLFGKYISVFPYHVVSFIPLSTFYLCLKKDVKIYHALDLIPGFFLIQRTGISFYNVNGVEWYISAMLIAMAIILPFAVKHREMYVRYFAPLSALIIYGVLIHEFQTVSGSSQWTVLGYRCVWRAIAGINLGMFANECVNVLKTHKFCKKTAYMAIAARCILWALITVFVFVTFSKKYEVYVIGMMFAAIVLTMRFPIKNAMFQNRFSLFLGKMSLPLYLNQILSIMIVQNYFGNHSRPVLCFAVFAIDFVLSLPCLYLGNAIKARIKKFPLMSK